MRTGARVLALASAAWVFAAGCTSGAGSSPTTSMSSTTTSVVKALDLATAATLCEEAGLFLSAVATEDIAPQLADLLPTLVFNTCNAPLDGEPGLAQLIVVDGRCHEGNAEAALRAWWGLFWVDLFTAIEAGESSSAFDLPEIGRAAVVCQ